MNQNVYNDHCYKNRSYVSKGRYRAKQPTSASYIFIKFYSLEKNNILKLKHFFSFIDSRERGRDGEREGEKH